MKYLTLVIAALMIALPAAALTPTGPSLEATLLYYEPVPATPGSLIDVYVQITNNGTETSSTNVRFVDNGPFSLVSRDERVKTIPSIPHGESALVKYSVRVASDAVAGTNHVKIEYGPSSIASAQSSLLPITISSRTVSLSVAKIDLEPDVFVPGNVGRIVLTLRNDADQRISSGSLKLELTGTDFTPIQSTNQERFTDLSAGGTRQIVFDLTPSPSMAPGVYKIPVNISFTDQQGNDHEMSEVIGVRVGATPDLSVTVDEVNIVDDNNEVFVRVTNKGLGEVKFVNVVIGESDTYELVGSSERYIGNIDSDDYKTARVQMDPKEDTVELPVTLTYMDSLNNRYTIEKVLTFKAKSPEGGVSGIVVVAILVIIGLAVYFVMRRRK